MNTVAGKIQIYNSALAKIGVSPIDSFTDNSKAARIGNRIFDIHRDEVLASHPWNFAVSRFELAKTTNTPTFGYDSEFIIPNDVLRILEVDGNEDGSIDYKIEHNRADNTGVLLCNESSISVLAIIRVEDVTKYSPGFIESLSMRLASDLAISLSESTSKSEFWFNRYERQLRSARAYDAQEGSIRQLVTSTWNNARYR